MNNIKTAQAIADRIAKGDRDFGRVYVKEDGPYYLLNYTAEAQYGDAMTNVEKACRGLVVRDDGKIMALPMARFFNLGEPQCPALPDEDYAIWEKVDGSLGVWWYDGERWRCNTRGSFENEYVEFAQSRWPEDVGAFLPKHWTIMTEICMDHDANPRAAYYPEGLYLIAVRDRYTGGDVRLTKRPVCDWKGFLRPKHFDSLRIESLLKRRDESEGVEGWVVRFDSGFRVKVKTAWYLRMFRAVMYLTPKHIRELMLEAGQNWIDEFPDDLRPEATAIQEEIEQKLEAALKEIYGAYSKVAGIEQRKEYALTILNQYPAIAGWLFALRDGKFDEAEVLRKLEI